MGLVYYYEIWMCADRITEKCCYRKNLKQYLKKHAKDLDILFFLCSFSGIRNNIPESKIKAEEKILLIN